MPTKPSRELPDPTVEPTIDVKRVAAILGIGERTAYAAAERHEYPNFRIGGRIKVPTASFLRTYGLDRPATSAQEAA